MNVGVVSISKLYQTTFTQNQLINNNIGQKKINLRSRVYFNQTTKAFSFLAAVVCVIHIQKVSAIMKLAIILFSLVSTISAFALLGSPSKVSTTTTTSLRAENTELQNRRKFFNIISTTAAAAATIVLPTSSLAEETTSSALTDVYFGVGCYWHIQHEFVEAERKILSRSDDQLTSRTGYAGGTATDKEGRVCYHNMKSIADYGKLGHGEVVGMTIPENQIGSFAQEYFNLFTAKGERVDPMDRGGEYRSLLGLPGGTQHPMYKEVAAAAEAKGMTLEAGKGNDPDTLGRKLVYVYDTAKFPFYQAEVYHQFRKSTQQNFDLLS